jgi:hypothetical protein
MINQVTPLGWDLFDHGQGHDLNKHARGLPLGLALIEKILLYDYPVF